MDSPADSYTLAVNSSTHHAIFLMDENGVITSWNIGGENTFGYRADEIIGCSALTIFTKADVASGQHLAEMRGALNVGYSEDDRWHLRKDGTRFWASGIMTPAYDEAGILNGFLKIVRDKTPEKLASERARYLSRHDSLTGLPNRSMFNDELQAALAEAQLSQSQVQVLLLDLDRFKDINDSYGHHTGDLLLKQVAERLRNAVRSSDLVARLEGAEFGIICKTSVTESDGEVLAEKLVGNLADPYVIEEKEIQSGASIGLTVYPLDSKDPGQTLKNADLAMYAAKSSGRSAYRLYAEDLDSDAKRRRSIGAWLRQAVEGDSLLLHYQPQHSLKDQKVTGLEALLRWRRCPVTDVTTEEVIAIAAETGLAEILGEWVLRTACYQVREWQAQGLEDFRIAVNVFSGHLNAVSFLKFIDEVLEETGVPPGCLDLEITETMLMENSPANDLLFRSLKKKGIYLSVDDFGSGGSSLSDLKTFPVDALKIDREFIRDLPQSEHDAAIASAIIGLAHSLDLKVIAEGIERPEQADFIASLGCDYGQGYLFGAPFPAEEVWER